MLAMQDEVIDTGLSETHRQAYNAAFEELGLNWRWDAQTCAGLPPSGPDAVRAYLQREHPHLLRAYEPEFLVNAIENARQRLLRTNP